jgi:hypothetical protein
LREGEFSTKRSISFWGHTFYGGNGGEVGFIYKENEELFNKRLLLYSESNNIDSITSEVINDFKTYEVHRFIRQEPHKWVFLQVKKFFYTFGVIPQRDGLQMLVTGKIKMHWLFAAAILQIPYLILIFLFVMSLDLSFKTIFDLKNYKFFIYLLGAYLIGAICIYAAYQERYRPVVFVTMIIPIIAINYRQLISKPVIYKGLWPKLLFFLIFILVWVYQLYEAFFIHSDRYFNALQKF